MTYDLASFGALTAQTARDEQDAATIIDIMRKTAEWSISAPHAKSSFAVMRRYAMGVWEDGRLSGEKIWRLGWSGIPWSPAAHALVTSTPRARGGNRFAFNGDAGTRGELTFEHVVPNAVIQARLLEADDARGVIDVFRDCYRVAVVTKAEGVGVLPKNAMPTDWDGVDMWARYRKATAEGRIGFAVEDMLIGPTFAEMRPLRAWLSDAGAV